MGYFAPMAKKLSRKAKFCSGYNWCINTVKRVMYCGIIAVYLHTTRHCTIIKWAIKYPGKKLPWH